LEKFLTKILQTGLDFLISQDQKKYRLASGLWLGFLFLGGAYLLGHFLAWGSASIEFQDWAEVTGPRLTFLKDAIIHGVLPLQTAYPVIIGSTTTYQVMAIPDLLISPQILLLPFLSIGQFYVFQVLFLFSLGFMGLLKLKRSQKYSILAFTIIFILFDFNGNILAHLSVGHLTWGGYFLFPWLALFVFELLEDKTGWSWTFKMALLLFFILLQGSYHQYVWALFLIGLLGLTLPRYFWLLLKTAILTLLLSLVRLLPEVTLLGPGGPTNNFLAGYPDFQSIWNVLVNIQQPGIRSSLGGLGNPLGLQEVTMYVGLIGAAFLVYFGFVHPLLNHAVEYKYQSMLLPVLGLLFLTLSPIYNQLRDWLPLAIFTGERVITRLISLVFVLVLFLAANEFQKWLNIGRTSKFPLVVSLVLLAFGVVDLVQNYRIWSVVRVVKLFDYELFTPNKWYISNNLSDFPYLNYVLWGAAGSIATFLFLVVMVWREKHPKKLMSA
jgi:hypothetical protein